MRMTRYGNDDLVSEGDGHLYLSASCFAVFNRQIALMKLNNTKCKGKSSPSSCFKYWYSFASACFSGNAAVLQRMPKVTLIGSSSINRTIVPGGGGETMLFGIRATPSHGDRKHDSFEKLCCRRTRRCPDSEKHRFPSSSRNDCPVYRR